MKKRMLSFVLAIVLILALAPGAFAANSQPSSWAQGYVNEAVAQGLVPNHLRTRFTDSITRAEFAALGVALYEATTGRQITGRVTFTDTNDVNVQKMAYLGVVQGVGGGRFNPDGLLTRQEAAAMLVRLINVTDGALPPTTPNFGDNDSISNWAMAYVGQMQVTGIMGGVSGNRFDPAGRYTIEQSIVTMLRMYNLDLLSEFLCRFNLDWIRDEVLDVNFTIGGAIGSPVNQGWHHLHRMLNVTHSFDLDSLPIYFNENPIGTQTGDVALRRVVGPNGELGSVGLIIDLGSSFEVWEARYPDIWANRPTWANENHRAFFMVIVPRDLMTECMC